MQVKIETLTARSIAGYIYNGRLNATYVYQLLEEAGLEDKLERVEDLLREMNAVDDFYELQVR